MTKSPNPIDIHVGSRIRFRRMTIGVSQERLGEKLNLTFQQVQKYEKGANRVGASRLFTIASILDVPVEFFFDNMSQDGIDALPAAEKAKKVHPVGDADIAAFLHTSSGIRLARAVVGITNTAVVDKIVELAEAASDAKTPALKVVAG